MWLQEGRSLQRDLRVLWDFAKRMRLGFGEYVLDLGTRQAFRAAEEIPLSPKAFQLLVPTKTATRQ